jgi:hypothetical protein
MAAINAYSNVLDLPGRGGAGYAQRVGGAGPTGAEKTRRGGGRSGGAAVAEADGESPVVELQLSEAEEMPEHTTVAAELRGSQGGSPGLGRSSEETSERDADDTSTPATATDDEEEYLGEEQEGEESSDTMTESQEDALSAENPAPGERRSSIADGFWACLSPVVASFWKGRRRQSRGGEGGAGKDAFEIEFADIGQLEFVGAGAQGAVFRGEYRGESVAVKKVKDKSYCNEISQLRKLSHRNIVQLRLVR